MANEKETNNKPEEEKKESWLEEALEKVNTDFPLSGGETEEDFEAATGVDEDEDYDESEDESSDDEHK